MNTFGRALRVSTWGESHGAGIGVMIDGLPSGLVVDWSLLRERLKARQGGGLGTPRKEADEPEVLSGIIWERCADGAAGDGGGDRADGTGTGGCDRADGTDDGTDGDGADGGEIARTNGDPIALFVRNANTRSKDYDDLIRPAHADASWRAKFGRPLGAGGGRASARESVAKVIAGAFAAMLLREFGIRVHAALIGVGTAQLAGHRWSEAEFAAAEAAAPSRGLCALGGEDFAAAAVEQIESARRVGDSVGASVAVGVFGAPAGLGEVLYDRLDARLAQAMMGLNAVKAVEIGAGAAVARMRGSEANDVFACSRECFCGSCEDGAEISAESAIYKGNARANIQNHINNQENTEEFTNSLPKVTNPAHDQPTEPSHLRETTAQPSRGDFVGCEETKFGDSQNRPREQAVFATQNNYAGGILGGLSTGESIQLRVHFKPTPSIAREQLIAWPNGRFERRCLRGRHDPCVGVRGAVVARSLAELVLADFLLLGATSRIENLREIYQN